MTCEGEMNCLLDRRLDSKPPCSPPHMSAQHARGDAMPDYTLLAWIARPIHRHALPIDILALRHQILPHRAALGKIRPASGALAVSRET
jgi:hypothetical protein